MSLSNLRPAPGSTHKKKRLGRGSSAGQGGTAGRGEKGYYSRSGSVHKIGFEGGQMPIHRRLPKRGFKNIWAEETQVVNVGDLKRIPDGVAIEPESLKKAGLIRHAGQPVKILGTGEAARAYEVRACSLSATAKKKITEAGGKVVTD
jgi:large subunit ribosomal protein L15